MRGTEFSFDEWKELTTIFQFATNHPSGRLIIAVDDKTSEPISGVITIEEAGTVYYWFAATKNCHRQMAGNSLLLSSAIRDAFELKKSRFDTCGMNSKEIGFFKASFGAKPTPTYRLRYC